MRFVRQVFPFESSPPPPPQASPPEKNRIHVRVCCSVVRLPFAERNLFLSSPPWLGHLPFAEACFLVSPLGVKGNRLAIFPHRFPGENAKTRRREDAKPDVAGGLAIRDYWKPDGRTAPWPIRSGSHRKWQPRCLVDSTPPPTRMVDT